MRLHTCCRHTPVHPCDNASLPHVTEVLNVPRFHSARNNRKKVTSADQQSYDMASPTAPVAAARGGSVASQGGVHTSDALQALADMTADAEKEIELTKHELTEAENEVSMPYNEAYDMASAVPSVSTARASTISDKAAARDETQREDAGVYDMAPAVRKTDVSPPASPSVPSYDLASPTPQGDVASPASPTASVKYDLALPSGSPTLLVSPDRWAADNEGDVAASGASAAVGPGLIPLQQPKSRVVAVQPAVVTPHDASGSGSSEDDSDAVELGDPEPASGVRVWVRWWVWWWWCVWGSESVVVRLCHKLELHSPLSHLVCESHSSSHALLYDAIFVSLLCRKVISHSLEHTRAFFFSPCVQLQWI
jgi:hypothetical protein